MMNRVKNEQEVARLRVSGGMLAEVLRTLAGQLEAGQTTRYLNDLAASQLKILGGKPTFLNYQADPQVKGFPGVLCVSVNDEVVHGIPSDRVLQTGDLVGLDFGVNFEGMFTDGAVTVVVGNQPTVAQSRLLTATKEALDAGIWMVRNGVRTGDISAAIEQRLRREKFGIVRELSGHGVGDQVHEDPLILNFGKAGSGPKLKTGMSIALEPMVTMGDRRVYVDDDGWTIKTRDSSPSAHFEHTMLVLDEGAEVLTV